MEWETILLGVIFTLIVFFLLWLIVNGMIGRAGMVAGALFMNPQKHKKKGSIPYETLTRIVLIVVAVAIMFILLMMLLGGAGKPLSAVFYELFGGIF
jgi:hypothetical protein